MLPPTRCTDKLYRESIRARMKDRRSGSARFPCATCWIDWTPAVKIRHPGRFSHSGYQYDELRSYVESTYGEMVQFSNRDYANHFNENTPALDFA
eukprot:COSAG02_NODE_547_length_20492_cov_265.508802_14_plen_95_part_00